MTTWRWALQRAGAAPRPVAADGARGTPSASRPWWRPGSPPRPSREAARTMFASAGRQGPSSRSRPSGQAGRRSRRHRQTVVGTVAGVAEAVPLVRGTAALRADGSGDVPLKVLGIDPAPRWRRHGRFGISSRAPISTNASGSLAGEQRSPARPPWTSAPRWISLALERPPCSAGRRTSWRAGGVSVFDGGSHRRAPDGGGAGSARPRRTGLSPFQLTLVDRTRGCGCVDSVASARAFRRAST